MIDQMHVKWRSNVQERIRVLQSPGFVFMHATCLLLIWAGVSWVAVITCFVLYVARMFGITAGYHRYFAHRSFKTSRGFQFVLACLGASAAQQGPLWWAAHHRYHHQNPDTTSDIHSPVIDGFWWSHAGWLLCPEFKETKTRLVPDLIKYHELRFINRFHLLLPVLLGCLLFAFGTFLSRYDPTLGTSGFQMLVWGFCISTVLLYHGTFTVNSLAHLFGRRRFSTQDNSRNNFLIAVITLGEGWHNNHHYYPSSERQGFYWWEIDVSHYVLKTLAFLGVIWDLRAPPSWIYEKNFSKST